MTTSTIRTSAAAPPDAPTALVPHWIGREPVPGAGARLGDVYDPAPGIVTKHVAFAHQADVGAAVAAAKAAYPA